MKSIAVAVIGLVASVKSYTGSKIVEAPSITDYTVDSIVSNYDHYEGAIAPPRFGEAVDAFDIEEPTIDAECY